MSYVLHLQKDKKLAKVLGKEVFSLKRRKNIPVRLMASIMSQQLSNKVAAVIYQRFLALYGGKEPKAEAVLATPDTTLRSIGLSNAKVQYVKNVAAYCLEHSITDSKLNKLDDAAVIELLTQIKGVGRWTVEMLLMFSLGREDVFAVDDLGIQQAMIQHYKLDRSDTKQLKIAMQKIADQWKPFRTYACLHLWAWKDKAE